MTYLFSTLKIDSSLFKTISARDSLIISYHTIARLRIVLNVMFRSFPILVFGLPFLVTVKGEYRGRQVSRCGDVAPEWDYGHDQTCWCGFKFIDPAKEQCCTQTNCYGRGFQHPETIEILQIGNCTSGDILPFEIPCDGICWNTQDNHGVSTVCQANGGKCAEKTMPISFMCRGVLLGICEG